MWSRRIPCCLKRGLVGVVLVSVMVLFPTPKRLCFAAHEDISQHSDTTAAVTNQGVQGTVSGGSSRNPLINDLLTVQDLAEMQPDLKQLNRLLKELGMTFYLEQSRDMTMFMPVDSAFAELPFKIHELSWQAKWRIMQYHIIPNDVIDLDNALKGKKETQLESWEGAPIKVTRVNPDNSQEGVSSDEYKLNDEAIIISKPPKIETFNGASYKINKVMLPPSMTQDDLKPAKLNQRINPEVAQRLRRRPVSEETPFVDQEQQLASVDGTVQMERSARDPRLPGSFRPDPLAQRSQVTPDFVRGVNNQHARWDDAVYNRMPRAQVRDQRKPQDEIMGFHHESEHEDTQARIKILGQTEGSMLPTNGDLPAITRISGSGSRPSSIGLAFESSENPDAAPSDPVGHFMDVLLGGRSVSNSASQGAASPASQGGSSSASQAAASSTGKEAEPSLFSMEMTPTEGPRVKALGLTEGLLPAEELITHHWSASNKQPNAVRKGRENMRSEDHPPLVSLWQRITRNSP